MRRQGGNETRMMHVLAQKRDSVNNMSIIIQRDTNLVFNQVRATALILLNYISGPIGRLGVNAVGGWGLEPRMAPTPTQEG